MAKILAKNSGVIVTLEENGLVKKIVKGRNHSKLLSSVSPKEMVDRELKALDSLKEVYGVQKFVKRESDNTFFSEFIEGTCLARFHGKLPKPYFDILAGLINQCYENGIFRIGQNRRDYLITPELEPRIIDFGNVIFPDDPVARIPVVKEAIKIYTHIRFLDLKRRYT